ncbi:hypothetical protein [Vacuolonema iberomarrocanum]|uniref:hypothetical protein n=1 Tax=Vacuolonema iberomarrocanum TaxID=3454632 RepID=UPI001A081181|nr:hypothetical protein [filamentous cyanobacterium LEGE 07170]
MFTQWFDWLGDVNAQMFREWKGRLKPQTIMIVIGLAIVGQALLMFNFYSQLPVDAGSYPSFCETNPNPYSCIVDDQGRPIILWGEWWHAIFQSVNWCLILLAMLPGVYFLATDIDREERQGTLDFIRLSPQSSYSILVGKMLGVPVLSYLAIACVLPLQWYTAMRANAPISFLLSFYLMLGAGCLFIYSATLLGGFLSKRQASLMGIQLGSTLSLIIVFSVLVWFVPAYVSWNLVSAWRPYAPFLLGPNAEIDPLHFFWFNLPLGSNVVLAHGFTLGVLAMASFWIWRAIDRCFRSPGRTILGKAQSYSLVAFLELLIIGFFFQHSDYVYHDYYTDQLLSLVVFNLFVFICLTFLLANQRQSLLDWSRFRHFDALPVSEASSEGAASPAARTRLWKDLLLGEKSPANLAIALNLLIFTALTCMWVASLGYENQPPYVFLTVLLTVNMMAIYASVIQLMMMMKNNKRFIWTLITLGLGMGLPLVLAVISYENYELQAVRWILLSPVPTSALYAGSLGIGPIFQVFAIQIAALVVLNGKLTLQLRQAGKSASKILLEDASQKRLPQQPASSPLAK